MGEKTEVFWDGALERVRVSNDDLRLIGRRTVLRWDKLPDAPGADLAAAVLFWIQGYMENGKPWTDPPGLPVGCVEPRIINGKRRYYPVIWAVRCRHCVRPRAGKVNHRGNEVDLTAEQSLALEVLWWYYGAADYDNPPPDLTLCGCAAVDDALRAEGWPYGEPTRGQTIGRNLGRCYNEYTTQFTYAKVVEPAHREREALRVRRLLGVTGFADWREIDDHSILNIVETIDSSD